MSAPAEKWSGSRVIPGRPGSLPRSVRRLGPRGRSTAAGLPRVIQADDGRVGHPVRCTNTPRASRAIRSPNPDVPGAAPGRRARFRETFRPAACTSAVATAAGRRRLEHCQRFPPVHGSAAQLPEHPVVRRTVAGASPRGSTIPKSEGRRVKPEEARSATSHFRIPTSDFASPRMQRVAQPAFHAGPSRCEPGRGHHRCGSMV